MTAGRTDRRRAPRRNSGYRLAIFAIGLLGSLTALLAPDTVRAAPGTPLLGFGRSGVVKIGSTATSHDVSTIANPQQVVARPDGGLVVAEFTARESETSATAVTQLQAIAPNGGPLPTWNGGKPVEVADTAASDDDEAPLLLDIAALPDGSVVTLTATGSGPTTGTEIARYDASGVRVPGWGGLVSVPPNGAAAQFGPTAADGALLGALACRADGSCYVGTSIIDSGRTTVCRVTAAGTLDPSFAPSPLRIDATEPTVAPADPQWLAATPDGGVIVTGSTPSTSKPNPELAVHLTTAGAIDPAFGSGGSIQIAPRSTAATAQIGSAITVDAAGRLIVASQSAVRSPSSGVTLHDLVTQGEQDTLHGQLARFTTTGSPDTSFGPAGQGFVELPQQAPVTDHDFGPGPIVVRTAADGSIVVTWSTSPASSVQTLRFAAGGLPDPSWDDAGVANVGDALPLAAVDTSTALRPDGSVAVLTSSNGQAGGYLTVLGADPAQTAAMPAAHIRLSGTDTPTCAAVARCDVALTEAARFSGTVTAGGAPLAGARVSLALVALRAGAWQPVSAPTAATDSHGDFTITLPGGGGRLGQWRATVMVGATPTTTSGTTATAQWIWGPPYAALRRSVVESVVADGALLDVAGVLRTVCSELGSTGPSTCGLPLGVRVVAAAHAAANVWTTARGSLTPAELRALRVQLSHELEGRVPASVRTQELDQYHGLLRDPLTRYRYRFRRDGLRLDITLDVLDGSIPLQPVCTGAPAAPAALLCRTLVTSPTAFDAVVAATT